MPFWQRLIVVGVVLLVTTVVARLIDRRIARRDLPPEAITRYRVVRRSVTTTIMFVGLLSALLVIPQVRAVAGGLLASSAVIGIVVGFASQRTLGNFVAGLLIAFTQPVRLGDDVVIENTEGTVEEIGLIYTFVRTENGDRLVIPNEKLASDTIRNSTIRSREKVAEISLQVPLGQDLGAVVDRLRTIAGDGEVFVSDLSGNATVIVRVPANDRPSAERLERELRLRAYERAACRRRLRMTPPPRGQRSQSDAFLLERLRKRRRQRVKNRRKRLGKLVSGVLIGTVLFLVVSSFTGAAVWMNSCNLDSLNPVEVGENSFIFAADGSLLGSIPAERNRQPVGLDQISAWAPKATIAIEDRRFYNHGALDWFGIVRALYADIQAGRVVQGGSTITQQLVRNLYIKEKSQTLGRKATEACLAIKLAREKSKTWILNAYMNQVYYGNHAYGIEAAAQTYFSKPARKLTLNQSALLAGLPQAPSVFDPFQRPAQAIARRDEVLRAMLGNGNITSSQYANAVAKRNLHLKAGRLYSRIREPYFFSYVREELQRQYGANTVRSGGLKVYTTIDPRLQRFALDAIKRTLPYSTDPAAAIVSINPSNGAIRAMTELSPGNPKNQVNFASSARRQPGRRSRRSC